MTFEQFQDSITTKQDELTDLLVQLHRDRGASVVKQFLRLAIVNYVVEAKMPRVNEPLNQKESLLMSIADAITTPCYLHS